MISHLVTDQFQLQPDAEVLKTWFPICAFILTSQFELGSINLGRVTKEKSDLNLRTTLYYTKMLQTSTKEKTG